MCGPFLSREPATLLHLVQPVLYSRLNFNDTNAHVVALYALDWDNAGRTETLQVVDASTNNVLDSESLANFSNGVYLVWNITGPVKINVIGSGSHDCGRQRGLFRQRRQDHRLGEQRKFQR